MMCKIWKVIAVCLLVSACFITASAYEAMVGATGVLKYDAEKSFGGYTLFSPMINHKTSYLIDMEGNIVEGSGIIPHEEIIPTIEDIMETDPVFIVAIENLKNRL